MAGTRLPARTLLTLLVVGLLVLGSARGASAEDRARYIPPTATVAPTEQPIVLTAGDDDAGNASLALPPVTETATAEATQPAGIIAEPAFDGAISGPAAQESAAPQENVRPRPDSRPYDPATAASTDGDAATASPTPARPEIPRLDDPVLRWLPEIMASSKASGTPPEVIAGVMRLESSGDPNITSPVGAVGLMQIMPSNLLAMGLSEDTWYVPATNVWAGGQFLASRAAIYGSWEQAVGAYFGFGCDIFGTCTEVYIQVAFGWASYYAGAIADPYNSGFAVLPLDWTPPPIDPWVEAAPHPVATPPPATPTPSATPTGTPTPGTTPTPSPTDTSTPVPTDEPTVEPTPVPTEVPTEVPTDVPTEVPTEVPTDPPAEDPTVAPVEQPPADVTPSA